MKQKAEYGFIAIVLTLVIALTGLELGSEISPLLSSIASKLSTIRTGS
jgi:Flp pilus assembly pilin Flp